MSKISKLLCVLLALVMVVGLFAGCVQEQKPTDPQKTEPQKTEPQGTQAPTTTEGKKIEWPLEEPLILDVMAWGSKDHNALLQKSWYYKELVEKTNVHLRCVAMGEQPITTLNGMLQAGTQGDIMFNGLSDVNVVDLAQNGFLLPLEDYINETYMPNFMERAVANMPSVMQKMTAPDGHIYALARVQGTYGTNIEAPLVYNAEWLKQVPGFENGNTPKNVEEMTTVMKYYRDHDMNGNGDTTDEIPFLIVNSGEYGDNQGSLQGLMNLWGLPTKNTANELYCVITDGQATLAPTMEAYKECLKVVNKWYEEDLLWDEFFSAPARETHNATADGDIDIWGFYNGSQWQQTEGKPNEAKPWWDDIKIMDPFDTGYDCRYFINPGITGYKNVVSLFNTCEEPGIVMHWLDEMWSLYGSYASGQSHNQKAELPNDVTYYDWKYEDGKIIDFTAVGELGRPLTKEETDWVSANRPSFRGIFTAATYAAPQQEEQSGVWPTTKGNKSDTFTKWCFDHEEWINQEIWPRPYYTADQLEVINTTWADIKKACDAYELDVIKGNIDADEAWEDFQEELEGLDVESLVEVLQEAWDSSANKIS